MHITELFLSPSEASSQEIIIKSAAIKMGIAVDKIKGYKLLKRSIDARKRNIVVRLAVALYDHEVPPESEIEYKNVHNAKNRVVIVGCGPAGMFAALRLIELGIKPIILERGKKVRERRRDLADINKLRIVNPDSNYCFGEGGAGTYSDGKLYTRSKKRGDIHKILKVFVQHGADDAILFEAHPHIGTNKLPQIVSAMSETITKHGGEIHFNTKAVDFVFSANRLKNIITEEGVKWPVEACILAGGHSGREIYELFEKYNVSIEPKPFALGIRIEHQQSLIDQIQYHCETKSEYLPPASYALVEQAYGRGVFSFCMCPGGIIAPAATASAEVVVNGWSPSKRNGKYANSGMVVSLNESDFEPFKRKGNLAGMYYQASIENRAFKLAGEDLRAPAQRVTDFFNNKLSLSIPENSYIPGTASVKMNEVLPEQISNALKLGLQQMGKKMKGYINEDAVLIGVESRTSSPVRIPREKDTCNHPQVENLFPCGEGAGYAGGILSAAMDGERCAEAIVKVLFA